MEQDEISAIVKKRADFEHKLNARGSQPSDYARYAEYEMNLEALRRKRVQRLGVKTTVYNGQRRVLFILDRATRKFQGDMALWIQYLDYARKEKANKKVSQILATVLKLHPTKSNLWIYAAKHALDTHADMVGARSYFQRGLRFCKNAKDIWLEYAKLEMIYIAKIVGRRRVLGLDENRSAESSGHMAEGPEADVITLPQITAEDIDPSLAQIQALDATLQDLSSSPALAGAIPITVFDAAMGEFLHDPVLGECFFDLFSRFIDMPCTRSILQHVLDDMLSHAPNSTPSLSCYIRQPVLGLEITSAGFPTGLRTSLKRLKASLKQADQPGNLAARATRWAISMLHVVSLDRGLANALIITMENTVRQVEEATEKGENIDGGELDWLTTALSGLARPEQSRKTLDAIGEDDKASKRTGIWD